ncbi:hypothetical protein PRUPE_7G068400 [Prunus persica]|uniref:Uncharacterized protein n=1 Tax=Prunus persica TaxID=3760 RepID=A0A251N7U0_PRUPE|nr:hypothetical protein PRUPE_7G068400 [Prunus persica]
MDMKKISIAIIFIAALMGVVLAAEKKESPKAAAPKAATPAPASGATATTFSVVGSLVGALIFAFFGYYLQ